MHVALLVKGNRNMEKKAISLYGERKGELV